MRRLLDTDSAAAQLRSERSFSICTHMRRRRQMNRVRCDRGCLRLSPLSRLARSSSSYVSVMYTCHCSIIFIFIFKYTQGLLPIYYEFILLSIHIMLTYPYP
nr:MAG: hypothetical protein [Cressdnaviricota sp.]